MRRPWPSNASEATAPDASDIPSFTFVGPIDPPEDAAATALLEILAELFADPAPIARPTISLAETKAEPVGLGNRRGIERRSSFSVAELKGLRLNSLVRFQRRFPSPELAEQWLNDLTLLLLNSRDRLRLRGVLRMKLETAPAAELVDAGDANPWRIVAHVRILYEHHYRGSGGAESLISRIPIGCDLEDGHRETTTVTDEIVRWDNLNAPVLEVTGATARRIGGLAVLTHPPDGPATGDVTLSRLDLALSQTPAVADSLLDFVQRVTDADNPATHIRFTDRIAAFLQAEPFAAAVTERPTRGDAPPEEVRFELGDWTEDGIPDEYGIRALRLPLSLPRPQDALRLEAEFDPSSTAVLYIRVSPGVPASPSPSDS